MLRIVNVGRVFDAGPDMGLIGRETALFGGVRFARFGVSYARPTRVRLGAREPITITDHVMVARLVSVALVLMAMLWRLLRD